MIPFNYHHLYYFYVIAREGSVSKAAAKLRLAQPTLSAQLSQFESFLNVKLFVREKRRLVLTEEGRRVLSYAKTIFDIGQELKDHMVDLSHKGRPHIHIGIGHYVPKTLAELMLDFILKKDPNTYVHLEKATTERLVRDLNDHILDIVLTDTPFETTLGGDISNKFIGKVPIVFCAHPRLAAKIKRFPNDLTGRPMIFPAAPRQIAYTLKEFLYEHRVTPKIVGEIGDIETVRRLALRGYGVAALNLLTVKEAPSRRHLVILNKTGRHTLYEKVYLITKHRKQTHPIVEKILKGFRLDALF